MIRRVITGFWVLLAIEAASVCLAVTVGFSYPLHHRHTLRGDVRAYVAERGGTVDHVIQVDADYAQAIAWFAQIPVLLHFYKTDGRWRFAAWSCLSPRCSGVRTP